MDEEQPGNPRPDAVAEHTRPAGPLTGRLQSVTGRGGENSRGLPPLHQLTIERPDGSVLALGPAIPPDARPGYVHVFATVRAHAFEACPVCGATEMLTREHVPQHDLGGHVMTRTCNTCNNRLGARVEEELKNWFDDAITAVRVASDDRPGNRHSTRLLLRATADGEFVLVPDVGVGHGTIGRALGASGSATVSFYEPRSEIWRVAALKHAYLAACLALGEVPRTPLADRVRADLLAARDWSKDDPFPESSIANGLRIARSHTAAEGPAVQLIATHDGDGEILDYGFSFAGTLFVSWPLEVELLVAALRRYGLPAELAAPEDEEMT